jgi:dTMP kinase
MHNNGLFITCEGGDGSGKSTALNTVTQRLKKEGYDFTLTREPGGNKISEQIRKIILDKANDTEDKRTEALLYAAARRQNMVETVFPLLDQGKIVISDRFVDSSLAYQGYARGIGIDEVYTINMFAIENRLPDLTVLFDIDPKVGLMRIARNRGQEDRLEEEALSFHQKVHEAYMILKDRFKDRFVVVDASKSPEQVQEEVYQIFKKRIDAYLASRKEGK